MQITWSAESFGTIDWEALAASAADETCQAYASVLSRELEVEADEESKAAKLFLRDLLSLHLVFASPTGDWLRPAAILNAMRREALRALASDMSRVRSADVRARIADAAWVHGRATTYQVASKGVHDYFDSARQLLSTSWPQSFLRLQRAVHLARSLGPKQQLFEETLHAVTEMLRNAVPTEQSYFSLRVIDLLYELKLGDAAELASLAEQVAVQLDDGNKPESARDYHRRAASCWLRAERPERAASCTIEIAATLERDAELFDSTSQGQ